MKAFTQSQKHVSAQSFTCDTPTHLLTNSIFCVCSKESEDFSDYQLKKLIKQSQLSGKIESLRKEMNQKVSGDISYALGDDYYGEVVEARRVASEDAAHYILIKGLTRKQQIAEAERCKARRLMLSLIHISEPTRRS